MTGLARRAAVTSPLLRLVHESGRRLTTGPEALLSASGPPLFGHGTAEPFSQWKRAQMPAELRHQLKVNRVKESNPPFAAAEGPENRQRMTVPG